MWTLLLDGVAHPIPLQAEGNKLWMPAADLANLLGWHVKNGTLCRADRCVPLPANTNLVQNDLIDLTAFAALLNMPLVADPEHKAIALAESPEEKTALLQGGAAPDFELTDLAGKTHRLSDYRGRKVLLVTWASWCGCREDLSDWQAQHAALHDKGLTVITVSQDAKREDAAPFIEAASPTHPALIDPEHVVSHRYGFINVPTAVWIDESGRVARPPRVEHASNRFSFAHGLDCEPHLTALKNWVETGQTDHSADETRRKTMPATWEEQKARAHHALAWHLHQAGAKEAAHMQWDEAIRLSPYDWTIRRGSMWLRGENPFGSEFAEAWMEWDSAGRPDYASLAEARAAQA